MDAKTIKYILKLHNDGRNDVASGKSGTPRAVKMAALVRSYQKNDLEIVTILNTCVFRNGMKN